MVGVQQQEETALVVSLVTVVAEGEVALVMLALAFLVMIGLVLIADGFGFHVPKGYIYAAMGFSVGVEILNIIQRKRRSDKLAVNRETV